MDSEIEYWVVQRDKNNSKIENKSDENMNELKNIDSSILEEKFNSARALHQ